MNKFFLSLLVFFSIYLKVSAQCEPQLLNCATAVQACDVSTNDAQLWNSQFWWDNLIMSHDLAETSIDLHLSILDTCQGLAVRCLLFLDLDGDGVQETVVDSDNPPPVGALYYQNAFNPNYSGGLLRSFDQRPVTPNQQYRFALNTTHNDDTTTVSLRWIYDAAPGVFVLPELAYGTHKVRWVVTNASGAEKICEKNFTVKDCKKPTVVCLNGLSVNIMPTQMISLWASDFLQYADDNVTPAGQIEIGIRKSGTGSGFPVDGSGNPITNVVFNCDELGTQLVELWAIDVAGNADFCETFVVVQDNNLNCTSGPAFIESCATNGCGNGVSDETSFEFVIFSPNLPPFSEFDLGACGSIDHLLPPNTSVDITPSNDQNPLNGVSTFDLVLIDQFIHGVGQFTSPYQWIAADANRDQVVDTFDIIECKKLILGIYTELPNNTSWRFVDKSYVFPTPNPLATLFPETITVNTSNLPPNGSDFVGIKICDVNCTAVVDFFDLQPENEHLIGVPSPNPTTGGALLPLQLLTDETVRIQLLDMSGRLLFYAEEHLPMGSTLLDIPETAMPQNGVYVWRVEAGAVVKNGKIVRQ